MIEYPSTPEAEAQLVQDCRDGRPGAVVTLYRHHWEPALRYARRLSSSTYDAEDIAATAFLKSLTAMRRGKGPAGPFRPYIFTAVRSVASDHYSTAQQAFPMADDRTANGTGPHDFRSPDHDYVAEAFAALPLRWQRVLWYVEIEGLKPREVAPLLGIEPNALSAVLRRARKGLRAAYLTVYIRETPNTGCEIMLHLLSLSAQGQAGPGQRATLDRHARNCQDCNAALKRLGGVHSGLRSVMHPGLIMTLICPVTAMRILEIVPVPGQHAIEQLNYSMLHGLNPARALLHGIRAIAGTAAVIAAIIIAPASPAQSPEPVHLTPSIRVRGTYGTAAGIPTGERPQLQHQANDAVNRTARVPVPAVPNDRRTPNARPASGR
ncbi:RNA polymerase sigma factor [Arthrobacter bambusae]|uniref:RNA polymerase sigma factor (Sigma-70 family) n=1 Tax=Arthrobacter bambusae TaxID=1338426 RepID=A0AAW8DFJ3_9MICC|nr:sigma-70 family RNA polymerase sigma factor [Arthrobacter bambusae]MDP9904671.1 RNA polymerase sigma factor (sigma-70 family) [Arthrobacter bambusae]MDQ0129487.1 RNA polymerase sigma factor (sigma-70 family) [Arthrobacter bambusae]MDQ0180900.1 RNA polymerase sigma factor (sigma-70 family) [Arthrobacter bambusae]